jgi:hypothetical protein
VARGEVPAVRIGRRVLFRRGALVSFVADHESLRGGFS